MASSNPPRQYDIVHLGPTGYTGHYTVLRICEVLPSDMTWAIAGRSQKKLEAVVEDLRKRYPERKPPLIEVCQQQDDDMDRLAAKTRVVITTVGPFARFGEAVVKACVAHGTGYVDATGEVPWVKLMIEKYHEQAKTTGAIIVPQCAIESAWSDLFVYAIVSYVRDHFGLSTKAVTSVLWDQKTQFSGGTFESALSLFELFSVRQLLEAYKPFALSPVSPAKDSTSTHQGWSRVSGTKRLPKLGFAVSTGAIQGDANATIVNRTWGLFQQAATDSNQAPEPLRTTPKKSLTCGPDFHYLEGKKASGRLSGFAFHIAITTVPLLLFLPPVRWLLRRLVPKPGHGPAAETGKNDMMEMRALAEPEDSSAKQYVLGKARWNGSMYDLSGLFLALAAKTILLVYKEKAGEVEVGPGECYCRREKGGILTPACLGEPFVEDMKKAGYRIEVWEES